jgi:hypothetical protein
MTVRKFCFLVLLLLLSSKSFAFNGHVVTQGPLKVTIGDIPDVTTYKKPQQVTVTLANNADEEIRVGVRMAGLVDEWHAVGDVEKSLVIAPGGQSNAAFQIAAGKGACVALYPVHIYADFQYEGQAFTAHAVQIFKSNFEKAAVSSLEPPQLPVNIVPANGSLPLWLLETHRVAWCYYDKPLIYMPVGWEGSSTESSANFSNGSVSRGATKHAIVMHPPWKPGGGTIFAEFSLQLPDVTPIKLVFSNAIRDNSAAEPPSDGVTFRVWADGEKLFERNTDSKKWLDAEVDLSKFARKRILLRLESHPGPKRDTTCDSSFWGEPMIIAGRVPEPITETERESLRRTARMLVKTGNGRGYVFNLDGQYRAAIIPTGQGPADAIIAIGNDEKCVVLDGLKLEVLDREISMPGRGGGTWQFENQVLTGTQILHVEGKEIKLVTRIWPEKGGLRIKVVCPERITDFAVGPADQTANRVYYGHGYCIIEPEAFRAGFGGHNLSTSHVGFDFNDGLSLLIASDNPPDYLEVNPEQKIYALHSHMNATMTLLPSVKGAFDCAHKYRPLYDKQRSGGFERKAGRFVFDIWGGRYAEIAETMKRMIAYGLTDSLLTVHVWQRWGYDYRLPDIYPPLPQLGTVEDMLQIATVCGQSDIPWGLHDNYIDFYPDASGYTYNNICYTRQGEPIKAWINRGRDAQSYRWRPDRIMPFVKRNMELIKPNLKPTHYFIDVFTSIPCIDFYDKQGDFHSMLETRKCWGETFAWIRDYLGDNAPMTSEAGDDQLIGYLDGADCQHLQLSPVAKSFCNKLGCEDWERVPWFDAVLHNKFSLHGVGYSGRYQGGRDRSGHGIESDDYVSAEILEGHALMIDRGAFGRGAIRKYWLAQDFIRSIALDEIESVEFVDGDIHRQVIAWKSGARVYVNRGADDWSVAGKTLPQYGYFAKNGPIESCIERIDGVIVEQSSGPSGDYFNARGFNRAGRREIRSAGRWNEKKVPINFGPAVTEGAFRCRHKENSIVVTPLPDIDPFTIEMAIDKIIATGGLRVKSIFAVDENGEKIRSVEFNSTADRVKFETQSKDFAYHVLLLEG